MKADVGASDSEGFFPSKITISIGKKLKRSKKIREQSIYFCGEIIFKEFELKN